MTDQQVQGLGFSDVMEFHRMVVAADMTSPAKIRRFKKWQSQDGTRDGLSRLEEQVDGKN